jgi:FMN phosphatase YigB (HAD superfamily)
MREARIVFLFDIDNTLIDTDRITRDIAARLSQSCGAEACKRYWEIFEGIRLEKGYADYLAALQRYREEDMHDPMLLNLSLFLLDYPFANRLFPGALDAIERAGQLGLAAILSDGDVVFQPRKAYRAGLADAVDGRTLIFIHKEQELARVEQSLRADRYVMIDDKLRILTAMKAAWKERLTTVWVRQGHYAAEPGIEQKYPAPDVTIERIADFVQLDPACFEGPATLPEDPHVSIVHGF